MDNAIISDEFKEIEKKVAQLIAVCKEHEATNSELKNKINSLEEELLGKIEAEKSYAQKKALIRSKVDSLLVKLEEIIEVQSTMTDVVQVHAGGRPKAGDTKRKTKTERQI